MGRLRVLERPVLRRPVLKRPVLKRPAIKTATARHLAKERRMTGARTSTLAGLRGSIARIESDVAAAATAADRVTLGHAAADAALEGGLVLGAVHEIFAEGRQSAAATGFVAGLARRVSVRRPLLWVRQDFAEQEAGALSMSGFSELGLDPRLVVSVRAPDVETGPRTT